jgi:uncharacterized membrane protein
MKKNKKLITGILFILLSVPIIFFAGFSPKLIPSQEVELKNGFEYFRMVSGNLFIQEITLKKRYIEGVDVLMANFHKINSLDNVILLVNSDAEVLYSKRFSSEIIDKQGFYSFDFDKKIDIGKDKNACLVIYSLNGDTSNFVALAKKSSSSLGKYYVTSLTNNDVLNSLKNKDKYFKVDGSMCLKTYESNYNHFSWIRFLLMLLAIGIGFIIIYSKIIFRKIRTLNLVPERLYLVLSLVFGCLLVFLIPPLQVPDEPAHYFRSFQLSEFNLFQLSKKTTPRSLVTLYSTFSRMNFGPFEKTTISEIKAQFKVNPDLENRVKKDESIPGFSEDGIPNYIFPYTAQAIGLFTGRIFNCSPVALMYFGRIFNLLCMILIIYITIKISPVLKWIFVLLGLMPMTLYLSASLSPDAMTISLSFFLCAFLFRSAFGKDLLLTKKDIAALLVLTFLIGLCKPPYSLIILLYFLIPVNRIGSWKKYILVFLCQVVLIWGAMHVWSVRNLFIHESPAVAVTTGNPGQQKSIVNKTTPEDTDPNHPKGRNAGKQKEFILNNVAAFGKMIINNTFIYMRSFYLESFVGIIGHLIRHLPGWLINFYLWMLLITAVVSSTIDVDIGWKSRLLTFILFWFLIFIIETGLYIGWTPVGQNYVEGVQGRYFIPFAPIFFIILISKTLAERIISLRFRSSKKVPLKSGKSFKTVREYIPVGIPVKNSILILILVGTFISLITCSFAILNSFYYFVV